MSWNREKVRLGAAVAVLVVVGFLVTSLAAYFVSRSSLRAEITGNDLPLTSDNVYSEIQRDLLRPVFISSLMASDTFLRDWVIGGEQGVEQITRYLNEVRTRYGTFTAFFVSERTRTYYHYEGKLKQVSEEDERDRWYFRTRALKDDYEINIDQDSADSREMTIFINYRVYDYEAQYIGAIGVGLTTDAVRSLVATYQERFDRTIYFFDAAGRITLSGPGLGSGVHSIEELDGGAELRAAMASREEVSLTAHRDGRLVHRNLRHIPEFGWWLVVEQAEAPVMREIGRTLLLNLLLCLVVTGLVLVLLNRAVTAYQSRIETLRGIVPICSYCKQIRDDKGYWNRVETYVSQHTDARFSHSICPTCLEEHFPEDVDEIRDPVDELDS